MIRLTRNLSKTAARFTLPARRKDNLKLFREGLEGNAKPDSAVWKAAKPQLKAESFGKCAYCEAPTSTVAHGDVEHFRPKDTYWWWSYCYFNYAYGCQVCNQSNKGTKFPLRTDGVRVPAPVKPTPLDDTTIGALIDRHVRSLPWMRRTAVLRRMLGVNRAFSFDLFLPAWVASRASWRPPFWPVLRRAMARRGTVSPRVTSCVSA